MLTCRFGWLSMLRRVWWSTMACCIVVCWCMLSSKKVCVIPGVNEGVLMNLVSLCIITGTRMSTMRRGSFGCSLERL